MSDVPDPPAPPVPPVAPVPPVVPVPPVPPVPPLAPAGSRPIPWLRGLLIGSLALNLLLVGIMVGEGFGRRGSGGGREEVRVLGFGPLSAALSRDDQVALRHALRDRMPQMMAARESWAADISALAGALRAEPYDAAAVTAAARRMTGGMAARIDLGTDLLMARFQEMGSAERRAFADRLERSVMRHHPGRQDDD